MWGDTWQAALTKQLGGASGEDRLFATLDTTLRRLWLPSGRQAILSDTVGFISDLPTQLFDAFKVRLLTSQHSAQNLSVTILSTSTNVLNRRSVCKNSVPKI